MKRHFYPWRKHLNLHSECLPLSRQHRGAGSPWLLLTMLGAPWPPPALAHLAATRRGMAWHTSWPSPSSGHLVVPRHAKVQDARQPPPTSTRLVVACHAKALRLPPQCAPAGYQPRCASQRPATLANTIHLSELPPSLRAYQRTTATSRVFGW